MEQQVKNIQQVLFAPDWVWMANRDDDGDNRPIYDTVRGVTKRIKSDADSQQDTDSTGLTAFSTTGFTISTRNSINNIKKGHIGWMWAAGGVPTTDNVSDSGSPVRHQQTVVFFVMVLHQPQHLVVQAFILHEHL